MKEWLWLLKGLIPLLLGGCLVINAPTQRPSEEPAVTSLPSPEEKENAFLLPSLEPKPPAVSYYEVVRQIKALYPPHLKPFISNNLMPLLLHDLDDDGHPEVFSLGIPAREIEQSENNLLSDYSRLFEENKKAVRFYLLVFGNRRARLFREKTIYLGKWHVYESFNKVHLYEKKANPVIVTVSFQTLEGLEREILVFKDASGNPVYRNSLKETLVVKSKLEDLDGDGVLDLFIQEKGMEEGTGYETFLTWYRWNGTGFKEIRSSNVVRNLKSFLERIKELLIAGDISRLLDFSIVPEELKKLKRRGLSENEILAYSLGLKEIEKNEMPQIRDVLFPEILEDPFTEQDERGCSFYLSFRIVDQNGVSYIADALLYMRRNPFGEKQFMLYPREQVIFD